MYKANVVHGFSPVLDEPGSDETAEACKFTVDGAEIDEFRTGRCARVPSRCISRVTS